MPARTISAKTENKFEKTLDLDISEIYVSPTFASDNTVYAISDNQLYRSWDGGKTWEKINLTIDNVYYSSKTQYIYSMLCEGNGIVLLSGCLAEPILDKYEYFLIKSTDGGNNWMPVFSSAFYNLLSTDNALFGITARSNYLKKSLDKGYNWNWDICSNVLIRNYDFATLDGQSLWTIYDKKLWFSKYINSWDESWEEIRNVKSNNCRIFAYGSDGEKVLVICNPDSVMEASISTDNGSTWQRIDFSSVPDAKATIRYADIKSDGLIVLSPFAQYILISSDYGKKWKMVSEGLTAYTSCIKCVLQGESLIIFTGTYAGLFRLQYPVKEEAPNIPPTAGSTERTPVKFIIGENNYSLNNKEFVMNAAPFVYDNRTFVPARYLAEVLRSEINWDETNKSISIKKDQTTVVVSINQNMISINGKQEIMDITPIIKDDHAFLPAKYIAEIFGYSSTWDANRNLLILQ